MPFISWSVSILCHLVPQRSRCQDGIRCARDLGGGEMPVKHKGGRSEVVRRDLVSAVGLTPVKGE